MVWIPAQKITGMTGIMKWFFKSITTQSVRGNDNFLINIQSTVNDNISTYKKRGMVFKHHASLKFLT